MDDFLYDIKNSSPEDVIILFKTLDINEENSCYVYHVMENPYIIDIIDKISNAYIEKGIYVIFYEILDGWVDHIFNKNVKENVKENIKNKIKDILIKILYSDKVKCNKFYIDCLKKQFNINYYAETMAG